MCRRAIGVLSSVGLLACSTPPPKAPNPPPRYRFHGADKALDCGAFAGSSESDSCGSMALRACKRDIDSADGRDTEATRKAWDTLKRSCEVHGPCACAWYGTALVRHPSGERQVEGLRQLEAACEAGVLDACDEGLLMAELCAQDGRGELCAEMKRAGAVPERRPEPTWQVQAPDAAALGCFEGDVEVPDMRSVWMGGDAARVGNTVRVQVCLESARVFFNEDGWDVAMTHWESLDGAVFRSAASGRAQLELAADGRLLSYAGDPLARVGPNREAELRAKVATLPTASAMCEAVERCRRALDQARPPDSELEGHAEGEEGLAACRRELESARKELNAIDPLAAATECVVPVQEILGGRSTRPR